MADAPPPEPQPFRLAEFVPYRVVSLGRAMGTAILSQYADEFGIGMAEWRVLALIGQHSSITAAQVVAQTPMDKVAVSRASTRLVEKGLVERARRSDDRRSVDLSLTPAGTSVFAEISRRALAVEARMLEGFSEEERAALRSLLDRLGHAVERL